MASLFLHLNLRRPRAITYCAVWYIALDCMDAVHINQTHPSNLWHRNFVYSVFQFRIIIRLVIDSEQSKVSSCLRAWAQGAAPINMALFIFRVLYRELLYGNKHVLSRCIYQNINKAPVRLGHINLQS